MREPVPIARLTVAKRRLMPQSRPIADPPNLKNVFVPPTTKEQKFASQKLVIFKRCTMDILKDFLESSTIHGLVRISSARVRP